MAKYSKTKTISKRNNNALVTKITPEKLNDLAYVLAGADPETTMRELNEKIFPHVKTGGRLTPQMAETIVDALMVYGLDTNYPLAKTVDKKYRPLVIKFSHELVKEYDCKTPSEKALAQVAVGAYARILRSSDELYNALKQDWFINERLNFFSILSKEIDRAERQFIAALITLEQFKAPSFEVNVKTENAFVAHNQQVNVNPPNKDNPNKNEIIEPK